MNSVDIIVWTIGILLVALAALTAVITYQLNSNSAVVEDYLEQTHNSLVSVNGLWSVVDQDGRRLGNICDTAVGAVASAIAQEGNSV
ncbi:hypothetical protein ACCQ08_25685 [Comamonas sp. SY3]|uniref:hypothetical protein n=1 Tax=Comamonas sp. SY3 TaxID=3243601 RepID=UPI003593229A